MNALFPFEKYEYYGIDIGPTGGPVNDERFLGIVAQTIYPSWYYFAVAVTVMRARGAQWLTPQATVGVGFTGPQYNQLFSSGIGTGAGGSGTQASAGTRPAIPNATALYLRPTVLGTIDVPPPARALVDVHIVGFWAPISTTF